MENADGELEGLVEMKRIGKVGELDFEVCTTDGGSERAKDGSVDGQREVKAEEGWKDGHRDRPAD